MNRLLLDLAYVLVCRLGSRCRRNFDPLASCWHCGRTLQQTRFGCTSDKETSAQEK